MKKRSIFAFCLAVLLLSGCGGKVDVPTESQAAPSEATETADTLPEEETVAEAPQLSLADGVYTAEFITDSSMFHANESCDGKGTLTVKDGQGVFHVSLASKSILNLYLGLAADAEGDTDNWLQPTEDTVTYSDGLSETVYGFDIPVPAVDTDFDLALIGKKGVWYDHRVSVANPVPVEEALSLPDGSYTCEVTLEGGSGRATVESPALLTVKDGVITATIRWSSPNYEYMRIGETQYLPVQAEGNSTFQIPVTLDTDMAVSASTVAMSQPHLVDYTLHFDSATLIGADA